MRPSPRLGCIGIDVGTHTVKLAQAVRDGAGARMHRAAVIHRPSSWSGEDALARDQPITSYPEIHAALELGDFVGRNAICSLSMNVCQLRCLNVPPGSDAERRRIIGGELAEEWSELGQSMEFDFWAMEPTRAEKPSDSFNVSVLAASRPWVSQLYRDCRQCGLVCWSIDGAPLAMARAVAMVGGGTGGRRVLAVDWGYSNVTLCVVGEGRPIYSRRVHDCAFGRVLEAITRGFDVTRDEAQHLVDSQGVWVAGGETEAEAGNGETRDDELDFMRVSERLAYGEGVQRAITEIAAGPIDELVRQIRRTLQFIEMQRRQLQPAALLLLGGGAAMRNIAPWLERQLDLPVDVWKIPHDGAANDFAAGNRSAVFGGAMALSASAWGAG